MGKNQFLKQMVFNKMNINRMDWLDTVPVHGPVLWPFMTMDLSVCLWKMPCNGENIVPLPHWQKRVSPCHSCPFFVQFCPFPALILTSLPLPTSSTIVLSLAGAVLMCAGWLWHSCHCPSRALLRFSAAAAPSGTHVLLPASAHWIGL